ncbi:mCG1034595, partial [Mus musculus]
ACLCNSWSLAGRAMVENGICSGWFRWRHVNEESPCGRNMLASWWETLQLTLNSLDLPCPDKDFPLRATAEVSDQ